MFRGVFFNSDNVCVIFKFNPEFLLLEHPKNISIDKLMVGRNTLTSVCYGIDDLC